MRDEMKARKLKKEAFLDQITAGMALTPTEQRSSR
jgi:hypothetical protein